MQTAPMTTLPHNARHTTTDIQVPLQKQSYIELPLHTHNTASLAIQGMQRHTLIILTLTINPCKSPPNNPSRDEPTTHDQTQA